MKICKLGIVLLALLLAAMAMVPMVSAQNTDLYKSEKTEIQLLDNPIGNEISNSLGNESKQIDFENLRNVIQKKYDPQLNTIIEKLNSITNQKISDSQKNELKTVIVSEKINRIAREKYMEIHGLSIKNMKSVNVTPSETQPVPSNSLQTINSALPQPLTLVQVTADITGGTGRDGANTPYTVNGGNQFYRISYNYYPGAYTFYVLQYRDEDMPDPSLDYAYDQYRLSVYGTIEDTQSFVIYPDGRIDFSINSIWDNGHSYATAIGQHGNIIRPWNTGTSIYISNVWNHAMDIYDRNSNMAKTTYHP